MCFIPTEFLFSNDTCIATEAALIAQHQVTMTTVLDNIQTVAPDIFTPPPGDDMPTLDSYYNSLAVATGVQPSTAGLNRFIDGVNEITNLYSEVCSGDLPRLEDVRNISTSFSAGYELRNEGLSRIREDYAKMLCLSDSLGSDVVSQRRRRQAPGETPCIFDGSCTLAEYCSQLQSDCACPEGGVLSPEILCPCEFFSCLDTGNLTGPVFFEFPTFECLAFVVDTTGSMKDEIEVTKRVIKDFLVAEEELGCYMLVPFNDVESDPVRSEFKHATVSQHCLLPLYVVLGSLAVARP